MAGSTPQRSHGPPKKSSMPFHPQVEVLEPCDTGHASALMTGPRGRRAVSSCPLKEGLTSWGHQASSQESRRSSLGPTLASQGQLWPCIIDGGQTPDKQKFFVLQSYRYVASHGLAFAS
jgi:hypothetical protein